jgi:hypothetical protein
VTDHDAKICSIPNPGSIALLNINNKRCANYNKSDLKIKHFRCKVTMPAVSPHKCQYQ